MDKSLSDEKNKNKNKLKKHESRSEELKHPKNNIKVFEVASETREGMYMYVKPISSEATW